MSTEATFSVVNRRFSLRLSPLWCGLIALILAAIFGVGLNAGQNSPSAPSRPPVIEPKALALLDKTIQALGGPSFLAFKSLTTRGRAFAIEDEQTVGLVPYESFMEYPDHRRLSYGKKPPVILINNGDKGWELDRMGVVAQPREQLRRWQITNRYSLENLLRARTQEAGMLIQDGGVDFVDQLPARVVTMIDARQVEIKVFLDKTTYLPIRITYRVRNAAGDDWDEYADVFGDYQKFQNIQTPKQITRYLNGDRVSETFRSAVKYDESYPAGYFELPKQ